MDCCVLFIKSWLFHAITKKTFILVLIYNVLVSSYLKSILKYASFVVGEIYNNIVIVERQDYLYVLHIKHALSK